MSQRSEQLNSNDRRARKSVRDIRQALLALIAEKPYEQIRVVDIERLAPVNKNTFYKYYESKDDVLSDIEQALLGEMQESLSELNASDLGGAVLIFYRLLESDDAGIHALVNDAEYADFYGRLLSDYFSLDYFRHLCDGAGTADDSIISVYIASSVDGIYRRWKAQEPSRTPATIDDLAAFTAHLLLTGLGGMSDR